MSSNASINPYTKKPYSENYSTLLKSRRNLPVYQSMPEILKAVKENTVVVLVGETGSGKTTQLPPELISSLPAGKKISLTQNRRLAVDMVGARIAEEMDVPLGSVVGIQHRNNRNIGPDTRLEIVTDGVLLQVAKTDPNLSKSGVVIIDEAHTRNKNSDILIGMLTEVAVTRKNDIKIVVMSATINAAFFLDLFKASSPVLVEVPGRAYEVAISYLPQPLPDDAIVEVIFQRHLRGKAGDILVFVSGVPEINQISQKVRQELKGARFEDGMMGPLDVYSLHAGLSDQEQARTIESVAPPPRKGKLGRKLIISTNIAEASVTLEGVVHVIDTCKVKRKIYNPRDDSWALRELFVSKAQADQRAGRAGRTEPGTCTRMCTERGFNEQLLDHSPPEILESRMDDIIMSILKMGKNPLTFPYPTAPAPESVVRAFGTLFAMGAVNMRGELTDFGKTLGRLPIDVDLAFMLLEGSRLQCADEILSIVAMLEQLRGGSQLFTPRPKPCSPAEETKRNKAERKFDHPGSDHIRLLNIYAAWRNAERMGRGDEFIAEHYLLGSTIKSADSNRLRLLKILCNDKDTVGKEDAHKWMPNYLLPNEPGYYEYILKALAAGAFLRVAKRTPCGQFFETVRCGTNTVIPPMTSAVNIKLPDHEWVVYDELNYRKGLPQINIVTTMPLHLIVKAQSRHWCDVDFLTGHIQDGFVETLVKMTSKFEAFIRGGLPNRA